MAQENEELGTVREEIRAANKRLGPPIDTLRWFVRDFLEMNPKELSPNERALVTYNLFASAGVTGHGLSSLSRERDITPLDARSLGRVQQEIRQALKGLLHLRDNFGAWEPPGMVKLMVSRWTPTGSDEPSFDISYHSDNTLHFAFSGFTKALLTAGNHLRNCKRCERPFVANMRQEYCSTNCSQIVRNEKKKQIREERKAKQKTK
jgi:hypothetical protein